MGIMSKDQPFDNELVTQLLRSYLESQDPMLLAQIINQECKPLISIITRKYAGNVPQEDLEQEARLKLIDALPKFDFYKGRRCPKCDTETETEGTVVCESCGEEFKSKRALLFSYASNVVRNIAIDYARKHGRPEDDIPDIEEDMNPAEADMHFVTMVQEQLQGWFEKRFADMVPEHLSVEVLENVLTNLIEPTCGMRESVKWLTYNYGFDRKIARTIFNVVLVKLRIMMGVNGHYPEPKTHTLMPELLELLGATEYARQRSAFAGLSLRYTKE